MNTIELTNEKGEKKLYYILVKFNIEGKKDDYILFTDTVDKIEEGVNIYYAILKEDNKIEYVKDKKDIKEIEEYIKTIEDDFNNGMIM